jgi:mannose-6-phosphate isomerase-like protein (cupin superfamily)
MYEALLMEAMKIRPTSSSCGNIYELGKSFCGSLAVAEIFGATAPHYHPVGGNDFAEKYEVISGKGILVIGHDVFHIQPGDIIEIPPMHAHYTIPEGVMWALVTNTPPRAAENTIALSKDNEYVEYSQKFERILLLETYQKRLGINLNRCFQKLPTKDIRDRLTVH